MSFDTSFIHINIQIIFYCSLLLSFLYLKTNFQKVFLYAEQNRYDDYPNYYKVEVVQIIVYLWFSQAKILN